MATQTATLLTVVPSSQTEKEIENTVDAPRILADAIEDLKKKRADAKADLAQAIAKDLAAAPLKVDSAVARYNAWKASDDALAAKIKTCDELGPIIEELIEELKITQPEVLKAVLARKIEELEKEAAAEKDKAALLKEQIDALKALLQELSKKDHQAAKSKK